jgi:hypothetical protein
MAAFGESAKGAGRGFAPKNLFIVSGFPGRGLPRYRHCEERKRRGNPCSGAAFQKIGVCLKAAWIAASLRSSQ